MKFEIHQIHDKEKYLVNIQDEKSVFFMAWNLYFNDICPEKLNMLADKIWASPHLFFSFRDDYPYLPSVKSARLFIKEIEKVMKD